jgi:acetylornithine deacetylase/succinyl-diaminopimelate desuccinylase-like protein
MHRLSKRYAQAATSHEKLVVSLQENARQANEHVLLDDLRGATKVVALTLLDLLGAVP